MEPLIVRMVDADPAQRPTMDEVVVSFKEIVSKLSYFRLRSRLVVRRDNRVVNFVKGVHYFSSRAVPHWLTRRSPIPTPKE